MNNIYNTPLELGTRALFILNSISPHSANLERIAYFDYISIYSSEFNGPKNLHPDVPLHQMEFILRMDTLKSGLSLMVKKKIVDIELKKTGIYYSLGEFSYSFLSFLDSPYHNMLKKRCDWVSQHFQKHTDIELNDLFGISGKFWTNKL